MSKKYLFRKERPYSNPYRVLAMLVVVLGGVFLLRSYDRGEVKPFFDPTPTPTRTSNSYAMEGQTHFQAGNLDRAIAAYRQAVETEPNNAGLWAELAQIEAYSSSLLTTNERRETRLAEALQAAEKAVEIDPDSSSAHAIRAFVLDWYATYQEGDDVTDMLIEAEKAAQRALVLDQNNVLALAYSAEILLDQQKYDQAQQYIDQALQRGDHLMDVHRVHAGLLETLGAYQSAIAAYERAIEIAPNLTFLYIRVGVIYRFLGMSAANDTLQMQNYEKALDFFAQAVEKNKQLGIEDPNPYLAIGKVYSQMGEFFIASRNVERAVQIDPTSQDLYAELGMVYWRARNYEGAIPALKCAVKGCSASESCEVRGCDPANDPPIEIKGIPLRKIDQITVVYYYTYGSVLAGMYRPVGETADYCDRSLEVLGEVRSLFSDDPSIMSIVESSEAICESFGITRSSIP